MKKLFLFPMLLMFPAICRSDVVINGDSVFNQLWVNAASPADLYNEDGTLIRNEDGTVVTAGN